MLYKKATLNELNSFSIKNRLTCLFIKETKTYSSNLMRFFYFSQIWWNFVSLMFTSRSHQAWWVAFVKSDESLAIWWNAIIWIVFKLFSDDKSLSIWWNAIVWIVLSEADTSLNKSRTNIHHSTCRRRVENEHASLAESRLDNQKHWRWDCQRYRW